MPRSESDVPQQALEALGRRLEGRGFTFSPRAFFASNGIIVSRPAESPGACAPAPREVVRGPHPPEYSPADITRAPRWVALYHSGAVWEARGGGGVSLFASMG
ncbi:hypothetical protein WA016_01299 [Myxococcus stipitatus]